MKENKLTPEEIKKALECCGNTDDGCLHCPLYGSPAPECGMRLCRESLDLINRQQAEIERLQNESIGNCELAISMRNDNNLKGDCSYCIDKAKAEAIKEFAEKLNEQFKVLTYEPKTQRKTLPVVVVKQKVDGILQNGCPHIVNKVLKEMKDGISV